MPMMGPMTPMRDLIEAMLKQLKFCLAEELLLQRLRMCMACYETSVGLRGVQLAAGVLLRPC